MGKRTHDFSDVTTFKDRFRHLSVDQLLKKQALPALTKAARSAIRQLIAEKQQVQDEAFNSDEVAALQRAVCERYATEYVRLAAELKVGLARQTMHLQPLNGLRHPPAGDTSGWYLWAGEDLGSHADFFQAVHVAHLLQICPAGIPYLGLPPGCDFSSLRDTRMYGSILR